ncbi:MAG: hypothetical protein AB8B59_12085 [Maribacter sp.]
MANQLEPNNVNASDEIDLGQVLKLLQKGLHRLGNFFLRIFIYLRRNILKLVGLIILGLAISFGLSQIISKNLKTDVIVHPNFESKNYLYDVVDEIAANIKSRNESFFSTMDISTADLEGFKIEIEAIEDEEDKTDDSILNQVKYLEVLQNFKDESFVIDILRSELSEKSVIDHKITFTYKDFDKGPAAVTKLMTYINTNEYFNELRLVHAENAKSRIEKNSQLIIQVDQLVENYSKALLAEKQKSGSGVVYMEKENALDVPTLLKMKNELLKEIENKKLEVARQTDVISILNFGKSQEVKKTFFTQTYFLIPTLLVLGFLLLSFFQYLSRKAKEIQ